VKTSGDTIKSQFIDFDLGSIKNESLSAGRSITMSLDGGNLYEFWGNRFDLIPELAQVRIIDVQFLLSGTTPELSTYIEVVQPLSEFTPVLSNYTNISNGALGVFASVETLIRTATLTDLSMRMLNENPLTNTYDFCVASDWPGNSFLCP